MTTVNISLPEPMKQFVDRQIVQGDFGTVSEYFRSLIRAEQKRRALDELEEKLLEGLNSGPATPMTARDWQQLKDRLKRRSRSRKD